MKSNGINDLIREGDEQLGRGKLDAAEVAYRRALHLDNESVEALYSIGCVYSDREEFEAAIQWARKALAINEKHAPSRALIGGCLLGLERFAEAKRELTEAYPDGPPLEVLGQIGLCCEALGEYEEAETFLRQALENDPSYVTRYASVAWYSYQPRFADLHHFLARVLQRQGKIEEAKLHYYLSKRNDATIELDPMFREIMTDADLEDHPGFDQPREPTNTTERLARIIRLEEYDDFRSALASLEAELDIPQIAGLIMAFQSTGEFYMSARMRAIGDELAGKPNREFFEALNSYAWKRFLELVERTHKGELTEEDTLPQLERLEFDWESAELLLALTNRFIELDVDSGLTLANFVSRLLALSPIADHSPAAQIMLGKALARARMVDKAEKALQRAFATASQRGLALLELEALAALQHHYTQRGRFEEALGVADTYINIAERAGTERDVIWARLARSALLVQVGRVEEAFAECIGLLPKWQVADAIGRPGEFRSLVESTARAAGHEVPPDLLHNLSMAVEEESPIEALISQAQALLDEEQWDEAVSLLEEAEAIHWRDGNRPGAIQALLAKGQALARQGKLEDAAEALSWALDTAKPLAAIVDLWPILMESARIASMREQLEEATEFLESALAEARTGRNREREVETLQALSVVLMDTDPDRAITLFGETMGKGSRPLEKPEALLEAEQAFEASDFLHAVEAYERLLSQSGSQIDELRPFAIGDMATAKMHLGLFDETLAEWPQAAALFEVRGDTQRAVDYMTRSALLQDQLGESPVGAIEAALEYARREERPGVKGGTLVRAGWIAFGIGLYDHAEMALAEALEIVDSGEWRDVRDALTARHTLAKLRRHQGRYAEALEQYRLAIGHAQYLNDEASEAEVRGNMGIVLRYLGQLDEAVEQYKQAVRYGDRKGQTILAATYRMNLAVSLFLLGRRGQAVQTTLDALAEFDSSQEVEYAERCLAILGQYAHEEDVPEEIWTRVMKLAIDGLDSQVGMVRNWSEAELAKRLLAEGRRREAKRIMMDIATRCEHSGDRYNQARTLLGWASLIKDEDPNEAKQIVLKAREIAELLHQVALKAECTEVLLQCVLRFEDETAIETQLDKLLEEWHQVRRVLGDDRDRVSLADHASEFLDELVAYYLTRGRTDRALEVQDLGRAQALNDLVEEAAEEPTPTIRGMKELFAGVPREAILLSIGWENDSLVTLTLTQGDDQPEFYRTGVTRRGLTDLLETFEREILLFRGEGASSWERYAAPLLAGISSSIPQDGIVFLALEEELQSVPVHAIPLSDGKPLLQRAAVAYVPNMQLLARLAKSGEDLKDMYQEFVCVGVAFQDEALALVQRFGARGLTGNWLDKEEIARILQDYRLMHVACHGYFDSDNPMESGLVLKNTEDVMARDVLSIRDLSNWRLKADLAVLSACETGRGRASASDFLGLGRAFLGSGARSVVTALWDVENLATQRLMLEFYGRLFRGVDGGLLDTAEAMRQAQLYAARQGSFCDWAAFKLTGWPFVTTAIDTENDVGT